MQDAMPALSLEKHSPAFNKKDRKINEAAEKVAFKRKTSLKKEKKVSFKLVF